MTRLAIDGGSPVRSVMLPYGRQTIDAADIQAVVDTLHSDWLTTGPRVTEFEQAFADTVRAKFAVAVSSGTAALHAAACVADINPGDEVIVSPLTFAASANCVRYQGGTVRFVDVRTDTLNIDPELVRAAITPKTRAIVAVDYGGQPCDLNELRSLAAAQGLVLIEDGCHALGATYHGHRIGSVADLTIFSLHPVKAMTTGEGGVITTDDANMAERLKIFRNHGITTDHAQREARGSWFYEMVNLGFNYRLTDFQSALGTSQLRKLSGWISQRTAIAQRYNEALADVSQVELPVCLPDRASAWHLYVIRLNLDQIRVDRAGIFRALRAEGIGVNVHYIPVPWHPYYQALGYQKGQWPAAEAAYQRILSLPIFPSMTDDDVADVVAAVRKVAHFFAK